jgi:hypothetical protein
MQPTRYIGGPWLNPTLRRASCSDSIEVLFPYSSKVSAVSLCVNTLSSSHRGCVLRFSRSKLNAKTFFYPCQIRAFDASSTHNLPFCAAARACAAWRSVSCVQGAAVGQAAVGPPRAHFPLASYLRRIHLRRTSKQIPTILELEIPHRAECYPIIGLE